VNRQPKNSWDQKPNMRICVVTPYLPVSSETFIRGHIENLPARVQLIYGSRPCVNGHTVLSLPQLVAYKAWRMLTHTGYQRERTAAYAKAFRKYRAGAVLAEYGTTGVWAMNACRRLGMPLIVHFHGYDASVHGILKENAAHYPAMFAQAAAVIVVSRAMEKKLASLGASPDKLYYNPYGVDCELFGGAQPALAQPVFLAVGRFVDKKAPHLTLSAFAAVRRIAPNARLRMIGEGPLLNDCRELAETLGVVEAVTFLGVQSPAIVQEEMRRARCFVQHSMEAPNGDCEGLPVGILEAGASGLPVVATRHAGIPDVVIDGETGFLVAEGDVSGMAERMLDLIRLPGLAGQLGQSARKRIQGHFSKERSIGQLWSIIQSSIVKNKGVQDLSPAYSPTR
jgi:colanic acid/amylovoran biosynthesis glycosyltransferase